MKSADRWAGAIAAVAALAIGLEARSFTVGFLTDPVGAKGMPLMVALLLAVGAARLLWRPEPDPRWPDRPGWRRGLAALVVLLAYAALLPVIGFLTATFLAVTGLTLIFGGPLGRSALTAGGYAIVLYLLFAHVLGLPLPVGRLFLASAG